MIDSLSVENLFVHHLSVLERIFAANVSVLQVIVVAMHVHNVFCSDVHFDSAECVQNLVLHPDTRNSSIRHVRF